MKFRKSVFSIALGLILCLAAGASGQDKDQKVILDDLTVITAEVVGIDFIDRALVLLGPDGDVVVVEVTEEARNFDQIELGDMVTVEYYESVTLYLGNKGETPGESVGHVTARSEKGEKPAGFVVETVDISASVERIDRNRRFLWLKGPDGRTTKVKVGEQHKNFNSLSPRDTIHIRFTEAIAISVETP